MHLHTRIVKQLPEQIEAEGDMYRGTIIKSSVTTELILSDYTVNYDTVITPTKEGNIYVDIRLNWVWDDDGNLVDLTLMDERKVCEAIHSKTKIVFTSKA